LREIEIALNAHPDIREAVCVLTTGHTGAAGELHAAYTSAEPIPDGVLRSHLAEHLPSYCVPTCFWRLAELPVTPNAKIDRNAVKAWLTTSLGSATRPDGQPNGNGVFGTGGPGDRPRVRLRANDLGRAAGSLDVR
jgi:acyl-coenzyme A synthetase/AMP-(fatty) acid ligase